MPRLFIAAWPPPEVLDLLDALPRPPEPGVRWVPREQWHVTLRFLGGADLDAAVAALAAVDAPRATATLGPRVSRLGRSIVCVPVTGLDRLAVAVRHATEGVGDPPDPRPFAGHITLARLRHRAACGVAGAAVTGSWAVGAIHLVRSTEGSGGATYTTVAVRALG